MANTFTKKDLKTGDIVVLRDRELGVVIAEKGVILFQNIGMGILDDYCDDLLYDIFFEEPENDIMEVVRGWFDSPVSFSDPYDGQLVFKRKDELGFIEKKDDSEKAGKEKAGKEKAGKEKTEAVPAEEPRKKSDLLTIIAQAFYGNRTMTEISVEDMHRLILGYLDRSLEVRQPIDRTIVRVPGTDGFVLVYNKYQEEKRLRQGEELLREEGYEIKPLAIVPELNLTLYSRCIALRMNENGEFGSLQEGDGEFIEKYLAR